MLCILSLYVYFMFVKKTAKLAVLSGGVAQIELTANLHVVRCVMLVEVSLWSNISVS